MVPTSWQDEAFARHGVSREVPCSALKGETVPDSLPATPKSPPTRRVPPRGPNLPLGLRGKAGGGARVTAGPKRPHLSVCPGPNFRERHLPALPALPLLQPAVPSCSSVSQACSHLGAPALALPFCLECISSHIYIVPPLTPFRCLLKSNFL